VEPKEISQSYISLHFQFCCLCKNRVLLQPQFDHIRNYIRRPNQKEVRPYCYAKFGDKPKDALRLLLLERDPGISVGMQIFNLLFGVDLLQTGRAAFVLAALMLVDFCVSSCHIDADW